MTKRNKNLLIKVIVCFLFFVLIVFGVFYFKKFNTKTRNPYTNRLQLLKLATKQEIAIGKKLSEMLTIQHGGLHSDKKLQTYIQKVGNKIANNSVANTANYNFKFYLLKDLRAINAFALPSGQIFVTQGLFSKLKNEAQLAAILSHEISHVLGKHFNQKITENYFWQFLFFKNSIDANIIDLTLKIAKEKSLKNNIKDEFESDTLAIQLMLAAGYTPKSLINIIKILSADANKISNHQFKDTHPVPLKRVLKIKEILKNHYE